METWQVFRTISSRLFAVDLTRWVEPVRFGEAERMKVMRILFFGGSVRMPGALLRFVTCLICCSQFDSTCNSNIGIETLNWDLCFAFQARKSGRRNEKKIRGLRISLNAAANIRVGADLYHVPVPGLFGASEPYHLIAFKEDPDSRPPPEALENAVPQELLTTQREAGAEAGARRGSAPCPGFSSSTASTGSTGRGGDGSDPCATHFILTLK